MWLSQLLQPRTGQRFIQTHYLSGTKGIYQRTKGFFFFFYKSYFLPPHQISQIMPFIRGSKRLQTKSPWAIWPFPVPWQGFCFALGCPGLRRAAAGAGRALRAADAVGRAAVLWGELGLLDLLCAGCRPTYTCSRERGRDGQRAIQDTFGYESQNARGGSVHTIAIPVKLQIGSRWFYGLVKFNEAVSFWQMINCGLYHIFILWFIVLCPELRRLFSLAL